MLVYLNESVHFYGLKCCEVEGRIAPGSFYDTIDILVATNEQMNGYGCIYCFIPIMVSIFRMSFHFVQICCRTFQDKF